MRSLANRQDRAEIAGRLHAVQPDDARQWGQMCAVEMLRHVRGAFLLATGEMEHTGDVPALPLPPRVMKFLALRTPTQWPHGVPTMPELRIGAAAMATAGFDEERAEALAAMDAFLMPGQRLVDHAMFGAMSRGDWMRWGYLHTDHHLRQFGR